MTTQDDRTLDEIRLALAPSLADAAIFDGWTEAALVDAASLEGISGDVARLAFPGGAMDMIDAWVRSIDAKMAAAFADGQLDTLKVRERIRTLVQFRLDAVKGKEEALRRAWVIQSLPQNLMRTAKIGWRSADAMWRLAGDVSTDYNHYTKRTLLAGIYSTTLAVFVDDKSDGKADTRAFLERRIDGVMRFEKVKAKLTSSSSVGFDPARFLGRLRYPQR